MIIVHLMVDYHPPPLPRVAERHLSRFLEVSPAVVVMGARQTGKTTLVRMAEATKDCLYATLDDLSAIERAKVAPDEFVRSAPRMIIDEVQRSPDLLLAIKRAIDDEPTRSVGRFVLTGSANLLMMRRISESLAGRASYLTLWPFTTGEKRGAGQTGPWTELLANHSHQWRDLVLAREPQPIDWRSEIARGGYPVPAVHLATDDQRAIWFDGYVRTYLERDLQDLAAIENLVDFRRLMRATCLRQGRLMNQAELGRDIQLPRVTVHRYLNLLETSYQLVRLDTYAVNRTKRLIKAPKLYWSDPGLAKHLSSIEKSDGAALENLVLLDLLAWREIRVPRPEVLYWRTASGLEVDFVIESAQGLLPIEVKAGAKPSWNDAKGLRAFIDEYPDLCRGGIIIHGGHDTFWLADKILAVPIQRLL